ncbi:hypothetical protein, partial [Niallia taxi]|uniref:hypothetical protein n=1 Tax=Niallia taxi TaxID=2499688 RepID=UPI00300A06C8
MESKIKFKLIMFYQEHGYIEYGFSTHKCESVCHFKRRHKFSPATLLDTLVFYAIFYTEKIEE